MTNKQSIILGSIAVVVLVVVGTLLALHFAGSGSSKAASSVHQSPTYCDGSGDNQPADDCVQMKLPASKTSLKVAGGNPYNIHVVTHPGLRTKPMIAEVQYRSVANNGHVGSWWTHKQVLLGRGAESSDVHNFSACAPPVPGTYQVRTAVWVENSKHSANASTSSFLRNARTSSLSSFDSGATLTAATSPSPIVPGSVVTSATSTLTSTSGSSSCQNTPDDEMLIEYFNQIEFSEEINVQITDLGTAFQLQLNCPPPISSTIPSPVFELTMMAADGSTSTSCATDAAPIVIQKQTLQQQTFCDQQSTCEFMIIFSNSQTQTVYCETQVLITLTPGNNMYIPNLEPATLPLCPTNFTPCVLTGQCNLSTSKEGVLTLCDSAVSASCTPPATNNTYAYNENVYFQSSISSQS